jgi:hypothetical protein
MLHKILIALIHWVVNQLHGARIFPARGVRYAPVQKNFTHTCKRITAKAQRKIYCKGAENIIIQFIERLIMCRLFSLTSKDPVSPMLAIQALDVMKEGHDGSGVGLLLQDLGGPFEEFKECPILSGIFTEEGIRRLDLFMMDQGFLTKYKISLKIPKAKVEGIPKRDLYLIRAYELPENWDTLDQDEISQRLMMLRIKIREMGEEKQDMIVFSFWPDTIMIKEIGDPLQLAEYLGLDRKELHARIIMAQGRQNTNYAINLYACHPFFIRGYCTMTNGENTAFKPIRDFLESRDFPGYMGYQSDSEVFAHILHYAIAGLGLGIDAYKHVITPLQAGFSPRSSGCRIFKPS